MAEQKYSGLVEPEEISQLSPDDIVERQTVLVGDTDECGHCEAGDKKLSKAHPKYEFKYKYLKEGTPEAEEFVEKHAIESEYMPNIMDCVKTKDGRELCRKVEGYNPQDWRNL